MNYVKLNDTNSTRVNLDRVVGYAVTLTASSEAIAFKLNTNNSGTPVDLSVSYSGATADEQVRIDERMLDLVTKSNENVAPASADQDA